MEKLLKIRRRSLLHIAGRAKRRGCTSQKNCLPRKITLHSKRQIKNALLILPVLIIALSVQAQDDPKPFVTTWETTGADKTITIPTVSEETYNYTINWGDDSAITTHTNATPPSHTYDEANTYTITISGIFPRIRFEEVGNSESFMVFTAARQIRTIKKWGTIEWASMQRAFVGCSNLTIAEDAGGPDLSNVTDMSFMFLGSSFNGDLSEWDVSNVKNMEGTFEHSSFNGDLSEWDVSKVTNMSGMFFDTKFNQDISNWNTSKVTDMSDMFNSADFNQDISDWNVSSVTDMSFMFAGSITTTFFNGDLSKWDVSKVTNMEGMFYLSPFTGDLSDWDVSSVTNMSFMFAGESTIAPSFLNGDLSKWDISSVTDMTDMFTNNTSMSSENYDKLLIGWSTLDAGESQIPRDITFDAPDKYSCAGKDAREKLVNDYSWSIKGDELVELSADENPLQLLISEDPIISLTPPKATIGCSGGTKVTATHPDDLLPIESDTTITWTFTHGGKSIMQTQRVFIGDSFITTWETTEADETITIPTVDGETYNYTVNWGDGSDITTHTNATPPSHTYDEANTYTITISGIFPRIFFQGNRISARQIRSIEKWGDITWTSMSGAFTHCSNLTIADEAGIPNLSNVTDMRRMFEGSYFTGNINGWNVSSVTIMNHMFDLSPFNGDISGWNVSSVTDMEGMFRASAFNGDISGWNVSSVTDMEAMFAARSSFNQDLNNWNVSSVTNMESMFYLSDFNGNISDWNVSSVTNMQAMFYQSSFNGDLSRWDISSVTSMSFMFRDNTSMSSENYDELLIGWSTLNDGENQIPRGITFDAPGTYSCAGVSARVTLTDTYSWDIRGDRLDDTTSPSPNKASLKVLTAACLLAEDDVTAPKANDTCDGEITASTEASFPITSNTTITWTYTDNAGNTATQTQVVNVNMVCPFITTWETKTANETITIPTVSEETYNYTVNWGDGSDITTHTNATPPSHTYDEANTYTITISGIFPRIRFAQPVDKILTPTPAAGQIRSIEKWGNMAWTSMNLAFAGCNNLTIADEAGIPNLSGVTDISYMFTDASFNGDLSEWDVSNVTNMSFMFWSSDFNGDISEWDVRNVTNMSYMFRGVLNRQGELLKRNPFNGDLSNWNTSSVTNMQAMFYQSSFNQDISEWDVRNVTDMSYMFDQSSFNQDISNWNVSKVTDMSYMFRGVFNRQGELPERNPFNRDLSMWDVSSVTDMRLMFAGASFNQDISEWDVSKVTNMQAMFAQSVFNQGLSNWNVSKVTDMREMFYLSFFNQDISNWNVSKVTDMFSMFYLSDFNGNISDWNVSKVTNMQAMFAQSAFNQDLSNWNVSKVTNMSYMFDQSVFNQNISNWNVSKVTDMSYMFRGLFNSQQELLKRTPFNGDLSMWDVSSVTDMSLMFSGASFNQDISNWNTSKVTNMQAMFYQSAFNGNISGWDVSSVTSMLGMFWGAAFNQDLSKWDVSKVINMQGMFSSASPMSSENYDKLLIGWSTLDMEAGETKIPNGITFGAPGNYTCVGADARETLVNTHSWTITGDSKLTDEIPPTPEAMILQAPDAACSIAEEDLTAPTAMDNCDDGTIIGTHNVTTFPITSNTTIMWTFTDKAGNTATQTQAVNIECPFITTWETKTANETITIPTVSEETYNYTVNWGDGSDITTHANATPPSHTYDEPNTYTITISGIFPRIRFAQIVNRVLTRTPAARQIRSIEKWGNMAWTSMSLAFAGCSDLTIADEAGAPNLSGGLTDMSYMFRYSSFTGDLSKWDVSNVTNMSFMFWSSDFNGDISEWNTSKVTDMSFMFEEASSFNQPINNWDVRNVTNMDRMFDRASSFNQDLSNWNTSKVTDMGFMFSSSAFNQDLSNWNVSSVTDMSSMFSSSAFNQDLSNWNVSKVTSMSFMFARSSFNGNISGWDVSSVTDMEDMFADNTSMSSENYDKLLIGWSTLDMEAGETKIPNGITFGAPGNYTCVGADARETLVNTHSWTITGDSKLTDEIPPTPEAMILQAPDAACSLAEDNLTAPTAMDNCDDGTIIGTHNVTTFPITESTTITWTYTDKAGNTATQTQAVNIECPFITTWETKTANETITIPTVSEETYNYTVDWGDGSDITTHANATPPSHTYDEPNTYTITISGTFPRIYFRYFLRNSTTAKKIRTIEKWGDNRWTSMQSAFAGCNNLTIADEAGVPNLSNVTDMSGMFYKAASFNQDISNWNVSSVTDMSGLFEGAASFNQDISDWEVSNVTNMLGMFAGAASFNQDISNWEVSNVTNMSGMFAGAVSFNQDISNWEVSSVTDMSDMFLAASFNQDISMWDVSSVTDMSYMFRGVFNRQGELLKRNSFNGDLSMWDVSSVTDMRGMFSGASFNQDISMWDVSSVTDMRIMFENNTSISSENYDKLLIGWSTLDDGESQIPNGITFGAPGNYTCVGADARETLVNTHSWTITGDSKLTDDIPPTPDATSLQAPDAACSLAEDDLTTPTAMDNCDDGTIIGTHNVTTFPITSNTTITWTYTDKAGNTATQTQTVTITDCPPATEPEEINLLSLSATDDALEAVVFPNPSGHYVEVQSPVESPVRILSLEGKLLLESTTNTRIDAVSLRNGLYLIQLPDGHLLKFIKK